MMSAAVTSSGAMQRDIRKRGSGVPRADVAKAVEHALVDQDAVGGDEILDQRRIRRLCRWRRPWRRRQDHANQFSHEISGPSAPLLISAAIFHQHGRNRQLGEKKVKSRAEADSPLEEA